MIQRYLSRYSGLPYHSPSTRSPLFTSSRLSCFHGGGGQFRNAYRRGIAGKYGVWSKDSSERSEYGHLECLGLWCCLCTRLGHSSEINRDFETSTTISASLSSFIPSSSDPEFTILVSTLPRTFFASPSVRRPLATSFARSLSISLRDLS